MTYDAISFANYSLVVPSIIRQGVSTCEEGNNDAFVAVVMKCTVAREVVMRLYQRNPVTQDMVPSYNALQMWPFIVSSYSGIEQSIKVLLKMSGISYPSTGRAGHRLNELFAKLPENEKKVVRESFEVYRSLHNYITPRVDGFLDLISVGFGNTGYDDWRYMLMDFESSLLSAKVPMNHAGAMLEIWSALADILTAKVYNDRRLDTVADRVQTKIVTCLNEAGKDPRYSFDDTRLQDLDRWLDGAGSLITGYADFYNNLQHRSSIFPMTTHLASFLESSLPLAKQLANEDQDFSLFLRLAERGLVRWDVNTRRFILG